MLDRANAEMRDVISSLRQRVLDLERQLQQELSNEEGLRSTLESETLEENELRRKLKRAIAEKESAEEGRGVAEEDAKRARGECDDAKMRMREERNKLEGEMERERVHYEGVVQLSKQSKAKVDAELKKVMGEVEELKKAMTAMVRRPTFKTLDPKIMDTVEPLNLDWIMAEIAGIRHYWMLTTP
jgi:chromosome segregation ATPase